MHDDQVRFGRRIGQQLNVNDVTSKYCQQAKGIRVGRLDEYDEAQDRWLEIVVEDKTASPADVAAMRIDCPIWLKSLQPRLRRIAGTLAMGEPTSAAANKHQVSSARLSQLRRELKSAWYEYQGEPAVA